MKAKTWTDEANPWGYIEAAAAEYLETLLVQELFDPTYSKTLYTLYSRPLPVIV